MARHKPDDVWRDDWSRSHAAVIAVVKWLRGNGVKADPAPQKGLRPSYGVKGYRDGGDIILPSGIGEVKRLSRRHPFTSREDFKYKHLTICEQYSYDRYAEAGEQPPTFYFIVNDGLTHMVIIDVNETRSDWSVIRQFDSKVREQRPFYHIATDDDRIRFVSLALPILDLPVEEDYPRSAWDTEQE